MKVSRFEIYTTNPETGESGWDIKFRYVLGETVKEAREALKSTPNFDCVILFDFQIELDEVNEPMRSHLREYDWADEII